SQSGAETLIHSSTMVTSARFCAMNTTARTISTSPSHCRGPNSMDFFWSRSADMCVPFVELLRSAELAGRVLRHRSAGHRSVPAVHPGSHQLPGDVRRRVPRDVVPLEGVLLVVVAGSPAPGHHRHPCG